MLTFSSPRKRKRPMHDSLDRKRTGDCPRGEAAAHQERHESRDENHHDWIYSVTKLTSPNEKGAYHRKAHANDLHQSRIQNRGFVRESK
jgi:hypothetical protein